MKCARKKLYIQDFLNSNFFSLISGSLIRWFNDNHYARMVKIQNPTKNVFEALSRYMNSFR